MEFLIGLACLAATVYFFYLMADLLDIRAERKRMERERRRRRDRKLGTGASKKDRKRDRRG